MSSNTKVLKIIYDEVEKFYNEKFKDKSYDEFTEYFHFEDRIDEVLEKDMEYYFQLIVEEFDDVMDFLSGDTNTGDKYKTINSPICIFSCKVDLINLIMEECASDGDFYPRDND